MSASPPGPAQRCPAPLKDVEDPSCPRTQHFLSFRDVHTDHEYRVCPNCHQIWEGQKFYQDYFLNWNPLGWEEFKKMTNIWVGKDGQSRRPASLYSGTLEAFKDWAMALSSPIELQDF